MTQKVTEHIAERRKAIWPEVKQSLPGIAREALKDVNNTMHQVFFGQQVGAGEPGTPLVPVPQEIYNGMHPKVDKSAEVEISQETQQSQNPEQTPETADQQSEIAPEQGMNVSNQELGQLKSPLAEIRAQVQQQAKASDKGKEQSPEIER
ncbi:hypothetical protein J8F10_24440 [Gemmata sp. G18]|uniref:Uncharacterized protein n=1 Tax=Gemmata palustris TaxID=2822762 RepID=A0ABS5BXD7_9BACT|nr:hypothetical protein [Gemmata palustris]MBP3958411.1 hypothetical protein [Gemmata palustris]